MVKQAHFNMKKYYILIAVLFIIIVSVFAGTYNYKNAQSDESLIDSILKQYNSEQNKASDAEIVPFSDGPPAPPDFYINKQ